MQIKDRLKVKEKLNKLLAIQKDTNILWIQIDGMKIIIKESIWKTLKDAERSSQKFLQIIKITKKLDNRSQEDIKISEQKIVNFRA